ncbi:PC4 domain-containing protein, partial [Nephila pilipes]
QLSSFRPYEKFENAFIVKKDICLFNLSDKDNECVSIQRLFQRKDSSFQFIPERILLNGENLGKLRDSFELVFECIKNELLTYTLCEYVEPEVDRLPENVHDLNYDADKPYGLYELTDSMSKVLECMNVNKRDCFDIYFERALYGNDWHAFAIEFVNLNKNNPYIKQFSNEVFYDMEVEEVFKTIEEMYVNNNALDFSMPSLECFDSV